mmetsp:Transcript_9557/g.29083  ORF Transcript_9557/g.29083 Transcript_9557/m.29083 type:complete len:251 (+) Transcript_9557:439-1191(+)
MWVARGALVLETFLCMSGLDFLISSALYFGCHPLECAQQLFDFPAAPVKRGASLRLLACCSQILVARLQGGSEPLATTMILLVELTHVSYDAGAQGGQRRRQIAVRPRCRVALNVAECRQLGRPVAAIKFAQRAIHTTLHRKQACEPKVLKVHLVLPRLVACEGALAPTVLVLRCQLIARWHCPLGFLDALASRLRLCGKAAQQLGRLGRTAPLSYEQRMTNLKIGKACLKCGALLLDGSTHPSNAASSS